MSDTQATEDTRTDEEREAFEMGRNEGTAAAERDDPREVQGWTGDQLMQHLGLFGLREGEPTNLQIWDQYEAGFLAGWDAEWLRELFEFEKCAECGYDADKHIVGPDPLGNPHAWCVDPIPESLSPEEFDQEYTRRLDGDILNDPRHKQREKDEQRLQAAAHDEKRRIGVAAAKQFLLSYSKLVDGDYRRGELAAFEDVAVAICGIGTPFSQTGEKDLTEMQRAAEFLDLPELAYVRGEPWAVEFLARRETPASGATFEPRLGE